MLIKTMLILTLAIWLSSAHIKKYMFNFYMSELKNAKDKVKEIKFNKKYIKERKINNIGYCFTQSLDEDCVPLTIPQDLNIKDEIEDSLFILDGNAYLTYRSINESIKKPVYSSIKDKYVSLDFWYTSFLDLHYDSKKPEEIKLMTIDDPETTGYVVLTDKVKNDGTKDLKKETKTFRYRQYTAVDLPDIKNQVIVAYYENLYVNVCNLDASALIAEAMQENIIVKPKKANKKSAFTAKLDIGALAEYNNTPLEAKMIRNFFKKINDEENKTCFDVKCKQFLRNYAKTLVENCKKLVKNYKEFLELELEKARQKENIEVNRLIV